MPSPARRREVEPRARNRLPGVETSTIGTLTKKMSAPNANVPATATSLMMPLVSVGVVPMTPEQPAWRR